MESLAISKYIQEFQKLHPEVKIYYSFDIDILRVNVMMYLYGLGIRGETYELDGETITKLLNDMYKKINYEIKEESDE